MEQELVDRMETWTDEPFAGGYGGLHDLADRSFTGAVGTGGTWLFMLNGRVIGIAGGTMGTFEAADGTAYRAPDPGVALLFAMQAKGGETQAKYFTDDTPLEEAHRTLQDGSFVGYIELSENVLSGDYYIAYYGDRWLSVAFVGNEERLLTGEEAFERACDEVGIYEVRAVDLEVTDIPEPTTAVAGDAEPEEAVATTDPTAPSEAHPEDGGAEPDVGGGDPATETATPADTGDPSAGNDTTGAQSRTDTTSTEPATGGADTAAAEPAPEGYEEEAWQETQTIPAIDPDESTPEDGAESPDQGPEPTSPPEPSPGQPDPRSTIEELRSELERTETELEDLRERLEDAVAERDELRAERDRLEERVQELERRLAEADESPEDTGRQLGAHEALDQTDVFVRYESKGQATLEKAHAGTADRDDVAGNLRLEKHTRFDADTVSVEGVGFETFLDGRIEYRFVRWLVEDLLYEIRDTDNEGALRGLYDTLPRVDRAEFHGSITVTDEEGEYEETFDVVCRDRMGQPLIVAHFNAARDPATGGMMADLIEGATVVAETHDTLGAAFLVTASFFEPAALETANEATGSGFLSRDSRRSLVKLSRKDGYHLCLAEARDEAFHIAVPEL